MINLGSLGRVAWLKDFACLLKLSTLIHCWVKVISLSMTSNERPENTYLEKKGMPRMPVSAFAPYPNHFKVTQDCYSWNTADKERYYQEACWLTSVLLSLDFRPCSATLRVWQSDWVWNALSVWTGSKWSACSRLRPVSVPPFGSPSAFG